MLRGKGAPLPRRLEAYKRKQRSYPKVCSQFMIFPRIILPNMAPVISSVLILTGVSIWNDYSFQLYVLQRPKLRTITLAISSFFSEGNTNMPAAAAATVISVLPLAILYLCLQKYFVKGSMDSAVK